MHGVEAVPAVPEPLGGGDHAVVEAVSQGAVGACRSVGHLVGRRVVRREQRCKVRGGERRLRWVDGIDREKIRREK